MWRRQLPFGSNPRKLLNAPSGWNVPTKGGLPAVIAVAAESSKVVRLASGEQLLPKFAPEPLPELRSTEMPNGEMSEMFRSESRVWVIHNEIATFASGPTKPLTVLVDSMLPISGIFVIVFTS